MQKPVMLTWNKYKLNQFKKQYKLNANLKDKVTGIQLHNSFYFDGHEFLIDYAKYLIQYLELRLK